MKNPKSGFNQKLNRYELPFMIYCSYCKKHICDSQWEMEPKLCVRCSGQYDKILLQAGVQPKK